MENLTHAGPLANLAAVAGSPARIKTI